MTLAEKINEILRRVKAGEDPKVVAAEVLKK